MASIFTCLTMKDILYSIYDCTNNDLLSNLTFVRPLYSPSKNIYFRDKQFYIITPKMRVSKPSIYTSSSIHRSILPHGEMKLYFDSKTERFKHFLHQLLEKICDEFCNGKWLYSSGYRTPYQLESFIKQDGIFVRILNADTFSPKIYNIHNNNRISIMCHLNEICVNNDIGSLFPSLYRICV